MMDASDFRIYSGDGGEVLVWVPHLVSYFRLSENHVDVLRSLSTGRTTWMDAATSPDRLEPSPVNELIECGLITPSEPWWPLVETIHPTITAFRIVLTEACNFACQGCFSTTALR